MSGDEALDRIRALEWWQGSVIPAACLSDAVGSVEGIEFWVIISQTCNLYNASFESVPVFEVVGARRIEKCEKLYVKGDHPRVIHVESVSTKTGEILCLAINILERRWLRRTLLAEIPGPVSAIKDSVDVRDPYVMQKQWLDKLAGWVARSYTRVTLPDEFNRALDASRIKKYLESTLTTFSDQLYGVYLGIDFGGDEEYEGVIGMMPPPYLLEIYIVTNEDVNPDTIVEKVKEDIFRVEKKLPGRTPPYPKMVDLAAEAGIRVREQSIVGRSTTDVTVDEMRRLTRYTFVDHFSDSSFASVE
ncbi:hypothetical protein [Pseudomonas citronellolis]|uniref:hypothetical protein n=1 Tax=Pseudomonas citronellolis TaxID=53408 RepID=UPI0012FE7270|nr:hypothetical protein [Pseudomonas citronellolis]